MMEAVSVSIASNLDSVGVNVNDIYRNKAQINRTPKLLPKFDTAYDKRTDLYKRIFLTVAIYLTFISTGFSGGVFGPTLVHLEHLYNTGTKEISLAFVGTNVGNLGGNILCAFLFDKINHEIQFTLWGIIAGIACMVLPFMPQIQYFYGMISVEFFALGIMYAGAQVYTIKLWVDYGYHQPALQGSQFMWCFGNFIIPFISLPFLDELPKTEFTDPGNKEEGIWDNEYSRVQNHSLTAAEESINNTSIDNHFLSMEAYTDMSFSPQKVRYIYIIVGVVTLLQSLLFFIGYILTGASCRNTFPPVRPDNEKENKIKPADKKLLLNKYRKDSNISIIYKFSNSKKNQKSFMAFLKVLMLSLLCIFILFHCWHRFVIGSFITTFTIKGLGWSAEKGALSTSVFYGFHALGSLFGVFISKYISPSKLIITDQLFTTAGVILLLFSYVDDMVVWVAISLIGFVLATVFPSLILWTIDYIPMNGQIGALFMCGSSIGGITSGMLVGYLFEQYSHMWMVYISLGSSILCLCIFVALLGIGHVLTHCTLLHDVENRGDSSENYKSSCSKGELENFVERDVKFKGPDCL